MDQIAFITPIKPWDPIGSSFEGRTQTGTNKEATMFKDVLSNVMNQVQETQQDVETKQYLLATGQLDDAHSLPLAEAKAALSLETMITLRNKAMESYNEILKMSI